MNWPQATAYTIFVLGPSETSGKPRRRKLLRASQLAGRRAGRCDATFALLADGDALIENFRIVGRKYRSRAGIRSARRLILIAGGYQESRDNRKGQSSHGV